MIQIDMPMPMNCLECRFRWSGDSVTYCLAQSHDHLHRIVYTYYGYEEQMVWRESTCPLISQEARLLSACDVASCEKSVVLWVEERQGVIWNLLPLEIGAKASHPDTGTDYLLFITYHGIRKFECDEYNQTWRCWTERPTNEQREAAPWES